MTPSCGEITPDIVVGLNVLHKLLLLFMTRPSLVTFGPPLPAPPTIAVLFKVRVGEAVEPILSVVESDTLGLNNIVFVWIGVMLDTLLNFMLGVEFLRLSCRATFLNKLSFVSRRGERDGVAETSPATLMHGVFSRPRNAECMSLG